MRCARGQSGVAAGSDRTGKGCSGSIITQCEKQDPKGKANPKETACGNLAVANSEDRDAILLRPVSGKDPVPHAECHR